MKPIVALVVLTVLAFAAAGCGATKRRSVVYGDTNSLATKIANEYRRGIPGIALGHRIGPVSFGEPKARITKALGPGVPAHLGGQRLLYYPTVGIYVGYPSSPPQGKPTAAAVVVTQSSRYKTRSGVGVGSSLRQLRYRVKVRCDGGTPFAPPTECQHERANIDLPYTVFNIEPTTRRVTTIAVVPGGD